MEEFRSAPGYEDLARKLIDEEPDLAMLRAEGAKVICVLSDKPEKDGNGLKVYAKTEKIPPKYKLLTDADVMITIYENNITYFTGEQKRIMMLRELLKILIDTGDGKRTVGIRSYDLNDFRRIVATYGAAWDRERGLFDQDQN